MLDLRVAAVTEPRPGSELGASRLTTRNESKPLQTAKVGFSIFQPGRVSGAPAHVQRAGTIEVGPGKPVPLWRAINAAFPGSLDNQWPASGPMEGLELAQRARGEDQVKGNRAVQTLHM